MTAQDKALAAQQGATVEAMGITCFAPHGDRDGFRSWSEQLGRAAGSAPGFVADQGGVVDPGSADSRALEWAVAVTFASEADLHAWLDSTERRALLDAGQAAGFYRRNADLIVVEGQPPGTGVAVFRHEVAPGREDDFVEAEGRLAQVCASFSGFEGVAVLRPVQPGGEWLSVLRFRTDRQLQAWLDSAERQRALPMLRSQLTRDFTVLTRSTPFGSILRVEDGVTKVTPNWKSAMLVLLVLYPTVMTLSRFLGPVLDGAGAEPWLSMWLSQIVSVGLMSFLLMPAVTGLFRPWLDPVQGSGWKITLVGVLVIIVVYVLTLTLFANVTWLQFWRHPE